VTDMVNNLRCGHGTQKKFRSQTPADWLLVDEATYNGNWTVILGTNKYMGYS